MSPAHLLLSIFTIVQLNCENLFDCRHDSLKNDTEYLETGARRWTPHRYRGKLNRIAQEIVSCGESAGGWSLPDIVALCEVENDSVMHALTRRSLLRAAGYRYFMTDSRDPRGIDVALMYSPLSFAPMSHYPLRVEPMPGMPSPRDILYVSGSVQGGDTLHFFVVHAASRRGGERATRARRVRYMERICRSADSIRALSPGARIVVLGDFNDFGGAPSLRLLREHGLHDISEKASGRNGARGTYRYEGEWCLFDHILATAPLLPALQECFINDAPFLLEEDAKHGGSKPFRAYRGLRYAGGYSDHLPLVAKFLFESP